MAAQEEVGVGPGNGTSHGKGRRQGQRGDGGAEIFSGACSAL